MDFSLESIRDLIGQLRATTAHSEAPPSVVFHPFRMLAGPRPQHVLATYTDPRHNEGKARWELTGLAGDLLIRVDATADAPRGWTRDEEVGDLRSVTNVEVRARAIPVREITGVALASTTSQADFQPGRSLTSATGEWVITTSAEPSVGLRSSERGTPAAEALAAAVLCTFGVETLEAQPEA